MRGTDGPNRKAVRILVANADVLSRSRTTASAKCLMEKAFVHRQSGVFLRSRTGFFFGEWAGSGHSLHMQGNPVKNMKAAIQGSGSTTRMMQATTLRCLRIGPTLMVCQPPRNTLTVVRFTQDDRFCAICGTNNPTPHDFLNLRGLLAGKHRPRPD